MLTPLLLLLGAIVMIVGSPVLLAAGRWQVRFPRLALSLWFGAFFLGCLSLIASATIAVRSSLGAEHAHSLWESGALGLFSWVILAVVGALFAYAATSSEPVQQSSRAQAALLLPLVSSTEERGGFELARCESSLSFACALPGTEPRILVTTGLERALTPRQFDAILAHEYAHLRQRHNWAVRIADVNALCFPSLAAGTALRRATRLLVELIADDTAARQVGPAELANALVRLSELGADPGMALRAERLAQRRWPRAVQRRVPAALLPQR